MGGTSATPKKEKGSSNHKQAQALSTAPEVEKFDSIADPGLAKDESQEQLTLVEQSDRMVNLIVQKLLIDQLQHIRIDDRQKAILFDNDKDS